MPVHQQNQNTDQPGDPLSALKHPAPNSAVQVPVVQAPVVQDLEARTVLADLYGLYSGRIDKGSFKRFNANLERVKPEELGHLLEGVQSLVAKANAQLSHWHTTPEFLFAAYNTILRLGRSEYLERSEALFEELIPIARAQHRPANTAFFLMEAARIRISWGEPEKAENIFIEAISSSIRAKSSHSLIMLPAYSHFLENLFKPVTESAPIRSGDLQQWADKILFVLDHPSNQKVEDQTAPEALGALTKAAKAYALLEYHNRVASGKAVELYNRAITYSNLTEGLFLHSQVLIETAAFLDACGRSTESLVYRSVATDYLFRSGEPGSGAIMRKTAKSISDDILRKKFAGGSDTGTF